MMKKIAFVFCFICLTALLMAEPIPSETPGTYPKDLVLEMQAMGGERLSYSFGESAQFAPFTFPVELTALDGEEREYTLHVREENGAGSGDVFSYTYIIDKRPPAAPVLDTAPGLYEHGISVKFENSKDTIMYSLNGSAFSPWQGNVITLNAGSGFISRYVIASYAKDNTGNVSDVSVNGYYIKNIEKSAASEPIHVRSPQSGVYANYQFLMIEKSRDMDLYYTLDGSAPDKNDRAYTGPVLIDKDGSITVTVAAFDSAGKKEYETHVSYTVSLSEGRMVSKGSGLFQGALQVEAMEPGLVYTLDDTKPTADSIGFNQPIRLPSIYKGSSVYTLQVAPMVNGEVLDIVFRYVYVIDTSVPSEPRFIVNGSLPLNKPATLSMIGDKAVQLHYTLDGSTPGTDSPRYTGPIPLSLDGEQGNHYVRGIAIDANGKVSEEASIVVPFDTRAPALPQVSTERIAGGYVISTDDVFGSRIGYEIVWDSEHAPIPTPRSPRWPGEAKLFLPHGMNATAVLSFVRFDEAGNNSDPVEITLNITNAKQPEPEISFEGGLCTIEGEGHIRYVELEGIIDSVIGTDISGEYTEPFSIDGVEGSLVEKTVAAYAVDVEGNVSDTVIEHIVIDRRIPVVPEMLNIQDHMVYTTSPIRFKSGPVDKDVSLHYTFSSDGTEPVDPTGVSPGISNLVIETAEGQEVYYRVKILPVNTSTGRTGPIKEFLFAVDRKMPVLPTISGFTEGSVYNSRVGITLNSVEDGATGYLAITEDGSDPGDPSVFGIPYSDTVYLYPEDDQEKTVRIRVGVRDAAGNTVLDPHEYRFSIDNIPPATPIVDGLPSGGKSTSPLTLSINAADAQKVYYRLNREEDWRRSGLDNFKEYSSPVYIDGTPDASVLYFLEVYAEDAVGNGIEQLSRYSFLIDRSRPKEIPAPSFRQTGDVLIAEWKNGTDIEYSTDGASYIPYTSPVIIVDGVSRLYYRFPGTVSAKETAVPGLAELPTRFYSGVENGSRQSGKVVVRPAFSKGLIRYEISIDQPASVSSFSPVFDSNLDFDVPPGLTRRYYVNFGYFESNDDLTGRSLAPVTFTIDKSPPSVPGIRESIQGTGKAAQKVIQLYGDGTIFYRMVIQGKEGDFLQYRDVLRLDSENKTYDTFQLQAYAEDNLGNRSPVKKWDLIIDQDIVYVSPDGNDYYDGSRLKPVKTIEKAIALAREQQRTTLYVFPGVYPVNRPVTLDSLDIIGGYGNGGRTYIQTGEYFSTDYGMFQLSGGKGSLSNITFVNNSKKTRSILYTKGNLSLSGCDFSSVGETDYLLVQDSGNLLIDKMELSKIGSKGMIKQNGGIATLSSVSILAPGNDSREFPLITSLKGSMVFSDVQMQPGNAKKSQGYYGVDSRLRIKGGILHSGVGSVSSSALVMINGSVTVEDAEIIGDQGTRTLSLIDIFGTELNISRSHMSGSSLQGSVLCNASASQTVIEQSTLNAGSTGNYAFAVKASEGSIKMINTAINGDFAKDATVLDLKNLEGIINHCLIDISGSSRFLYGVRIEGSKGLVIANSILINRKSAGTAVQSDNPSFLAVQNNDLYGWVNYGIIGQAAASDIKAFNNLDGNPLGGSIHENISEDPARTLKSDGMHLQESSGLVNKGTTKYGGGEDLDGDRRPNPNSGIKPLPDIGIDEVY